MPRLFSYMFRALIVISRFTMYRDHTTLRIPRAIYNNVPSNDEKMF